MNNPLALIDAMTEGLCPTGGAGPGFAVRFTPELLASASVLGGAIGASVVHDVSSNLLLFSLIHPGPQSEGCDREVSVVPHALKFARAYLEVLYDNLGTKTMRLPLRSTLSLLHRALRWPLVDFVKNAKFLCVAPMATYLGNPLPSAPPFHRDPTSRWAGIFGFEGALLQVLKNRVRTPCPRNSRLFASVLQGVKRGCEIVPASFIQATLEKYRVLLSTPPPAGREEWFFHTAFQDQVRADLLPAAVLFRASHKNLCHPRVLEASTSASFNTKRSGGGAREEIRHQFGGTDGESHLAAMLEVGPGRVVEVRGMEVPRMRRVREILSKAGGVSLPSCDGHGFRTVYAPFPCDSSSGVERLRDSLGETSAFPSDPELPEALHAGFVGVGDSVPPSPLAGADVMVAPVLEPLKVRLITKGHSLFQWNARWLQKAMWEMLQLYPQFALTGRPLKIQDFSDLLQREADLGLDLGSNPMWVSGDYDGATDHLNIHFTKEVMETLLDAFRVPDGERDAYRRVLYEQYIHFPPKSRLGKIAQANGQLMGSVLSFPILCWVNLLCYKQALDEYLGRSTSLFDLPVLVNGDDILFRADDRLLRLWRMFIDAAGFILSVGKNYTHERVFCINSRFFSFDRGTQKIEEIPWFNVGLLSGQSKLTGRATARALPLWAMYNETVAGARDPVRATRRFIHYNRAEVDQLSNRGEYNLFIAHELGGLGFHPPSGYEWTATRFQRQLATYLRQEILRPGWGSGVISSPIQVVCTQRKDPTCFSWPSRGWTVARRPFDVPCQDERPPHTWVTAAPPLTVGYQSDGKGEVQPEATWRVRFLKRGDKRRLRSWLETRRVHLLSRPEVLTDLGYCKRIVPPPQRGSPSRPERDYRIR